MATAKKLPSGAYRVRIFTGTDDNGRQIRKSFTAPTKKEAEFLATQYLMEHGIDDHIGITFGEAAKRYIDDRSAVLSPSTVREYRRCLNRDLAPLVKYNLDDMTQEVIQRFINARCANGDKPKTVYNIHGFISAVLGQFKPNMKLMTTLPSKDRPELYVPINNDVVKVISYIRKTGNKDLLIAILLGAYGPMRRSEVCALTSDDIKGNVIHVNKAKVDMGHSNWVVKNKPKTAAGNRYIDYPDFVIKELEGIEGDIVTHSPNYITKSFSKALQRSGVSHFRFHDLRHYSASIQHAMGIPDAYIMQRGGWGSDGALKNIYRHAMDDEAQKMNKKVNDYFTGLQEDSGHESGHDD